MTEPLPEVKPGRLAELLREHIVDHIHGRKGGAPSLKLNMGNLQPISPFIHNAIHTGGIEHKDYRDKKLQRFFEEIYK